MSFKTSRAKLMRLLIDLPEHCKNEIAPGMGMTWWEIAVKMQGSKRIGGVKALVRKAEKAGLI